MKRMCLLLVLAAVAVGGLAQEREEREKPDPNDIRSFETLFGRLEQSLGVAVQNQNQVELTKFLAPEFIFRESNSPSRVLGTKDWLAIIENGPKIKSFARRDVVIRAFIGVAVVSFVQKQSTHEDDKESEFLITDVWTARGGK